MDLSLFIQCLSYQEKKQLIQLLEDDLAAPKNETLGAFLKRMNNENKLPVRLRSVYWTAGWNEKKEPRKSPLTKPLKEVTYYDLYPIQGMGKKTWEEFVKLRGY